MAEDDASAPHQRRVRYAGTHPRRFEEKYKELDPARHAAELAKVMQRGQTPAGMHRPICVAEIMAVLAPQPGEVGLDATLGFGGMRRNCWRAFSPAGACFAPMSIRWSCRARKPACVVWASTPPRWWCAA